MDNAKRATSRPRLHRTDVTRFSQTSWCGRINPRIRPLNGYLPLIRDLHDEIGRSDIPLLDVIERTCWRHGRGIAFDRTLVNPSNDCRDLGVAERYIVLELLDTDALFDVPRRHLPNRDAPLYRARPWT